LLDLDLLQKYDKQKMYEVYDRWPQIAKESYEVNQSIIDFNDIDHIIFAGMGGSGTIGDIFSSILSQSKIHVQIVKGYILPKTVDSNTLVITTSVSGNTSETLNVLNSAKKINAKIIAFSSGGKMADFCAKNKIQYKKISKIHSPRASLPAYLYSILKCVGSILPLSRRDVTSSIEELDNLEKLISSSNLTESNFAIDIAKYITDIPLIYYPYGLQSAAIRFKNSLQENAKIHVITEDVIEACHNGVVAWEKPSNVNPILLEGKDDHANTKERWKILKEYFKENNIKYKEIFSIKGNILSKIINLIYLLDYSTIYLAVLSKTDPTPVYSIDFIKSRV